MSVLNEFSCQPSKVGTVIITVVQMRKIEAQSQDVIGQAGHPTACCAAGPESSQERQEAVMIILKKRELRGVDVYVFALGFKSFVLFGMISPFSLVSPSSAFK